MIHKEVRKLIEINQKLNNYFSRLLTKKIRNELNRTVRLIAVNQKDIIILIQEHKAELNDIIKDFTRKLIKFTKTRFKKQFNTISLKYDETVELERMLNDYMTIQAADKITNISQTTQKLVQDKINQGILEGLGERELSKKILEVMIVNKARAKLIARTEVHRALNWVDHEVAVQESLYIDEPIYKVWITARDERVRTKPFNHAAAHGQLKELNIPFDVSGERLIAPGIGGSAGNVCHCRCTTIKGTARVMETWGYNVNAKPVIF